MHQRHDGRPKINANAPLYCNVNAMRVHKWSPSLSMLDKHPVDASLCPELVPSMCHTCACTGHVALCAGVSASTQ